MDKLFSAGKQMLEEQMQQQQGQQHHQQQGQQHHQQQQQYQDQRYQDQQYQQGGRDDRYEGNRPHGGGNFSHDDDFSNAHEEAARYAGGSGSSDLFSSILGSITQKKNSLAHEDIDEEDAIRKHQQVYGGQGQHADETSIGTAAAMQALKSFVGGNSGQQQSQSSIVSLAMGEASKLFDQSSNQGRVQSGASKESAIQQAGEFAMKMYMKNKMQSTGGIADLASKFF